MPSHSCSSCGQALPDSAHPCPRCGATATASEPAPPPSIAPPPRNRLVPWLIGLPVGAFALLMLVGSWLSSPASQEQWVAREAIRVCLKEVARPPEERKRSDLTPADCTALETAFRAQYGTAP